MKTYLSRDASGYCGWWKSCRIFFMSFTVPMISILAAANFGFAWTPPSDSPLGQKIHPRVVIISDAYKQSHPNAFGITVSEIHNRIVNDSQYKAKFQTFIDMVDTHYDTEAVNSQGALNSSYNAINMAFLYLVNPDILKSSPYNLRFGHTRNQYADRAIEYARHMSSEMQKMTRSEGYPSWADYRTFDYSGNQGYGAINLSLAIVNDWINDRMTAEDKRYLFDGIINAHKYRYPNDEISLFAEGKHYGVIYNGAIGVLGFYGDSFDDGSGKYSSKINEFLNDFESWWLKSYVELHNKVFTNGSYSFQGTLYNRISMKNLVPGVIAMSTTLNTNYFVQSSYTKYLPYHRIYSVLPLPMNGIYNEVGVHDCGPKSIKITTEYGKYLIEFNPVTYGLSLAGESDLAGLHKWYEEQSGFLSGGGGNERYGMLLYTLLYNDDHVTPKSPDQLGLPLAKNVGNGKYFLRTGFTSPDDTLITFNARKWHTNDSGHAHRDFAAFEIRKYGYLTTRRTVAKDFMGTGDKALTMRNMWYNTLCVDDGQTEGDGYNVMGYRGGYDNYAIDPDAPPWQINGVNHVGDVIADDINNPEYDYIDYDYSNAWNDTKVDYAEREFLYLRSAGGSNDEYVVVFDRIHAVNPNYAKYWLLQCSFTPRLLGPSGNEVHMAAENYPNDPDTPGGRWVAKTSSPTSDNIIELTNTYSGNNSHGRLFNKTLMPEAFQINKTGGPGHYWEDANGKQVAIPDGDGSLTDEEKNYHGTYTMQVQSTTGQSYDQFLNVMQFGDANTLVQMTPVEKLTASGSNGFMAGAVIKDERKNRIVLFNTAKRTEVGKIQPTITYTVSTTAPGLHLLFNTMPNTQYRVIRNGVPIQDISSNAAGVIKFEDSQAGSGITYEIKLASGTSLPPLESTETPTEEEPTDTSRDVTPPPETTQPPETTTSGDDNTPPVQPTGLNVAYKGPGAVDLSWQPNTTDNDLAGYKVYYGESSRIYKPPIPVNKVTQYTLTGLDNSKKYYFSVTALDTFGNESGYSAESSLNMAVHAQQTQPSSSSGSGSDATGPLVSNLWVATGKDYQVEQGLNVGDSALIDRSYKFTVVPDYLINATYIRTAKSDRYVTGNPFLSFDLARSATVYVAFLKGSTPPAWVSGFTDTGDTIWTNLEMRLYKKDFAPGRINLGDNGRIGGAMYCVVIVETSGVTDATSSAQPPQTDATDTTTSGSQDQPATEPSGSSDTPTNPPAEVSSGPLVISNLQVASGKTYEVVQGLDVGARCLIDRSYTYSVIPDYLKGATYIKTAKGDRYRKENPFITFDVNKNVTVYIAYLKGSEIPPWLAQFTDTGDELKTNLEMKLFKKDFPAGTVSLGNNGTAYGSMYHVIIVDNGTTVPASTDTTGSLSGSVGTASDVALEVTDLWVASGSACQIATNLQVGSRYIIDRSYKYTELPDVLLGATYIQTAKADRYKTQDPFMTFQVNKPVTVYIAFLKGSPIPKWLETFTNTGLELKTNITMSLYAKQFPAGKITLGNNGRTEGAMYGVIIVD